MDYINDEFLWKFNILLMLIKLLNKSPNPEYLKFIESIYSQFDVVECEILKKIEHRINHDVKAVEYYIQQKMENYSQYNHNNVTFVNLIHFGLTSQDINSCAINLSVKNYINLHFKEMISEFTSVLRDRILKWNNVIILGRTHGQVAVPTTLGKEINVFYERFIFQYNELKNMKFYGKFGGAVGNLNAHKLAYPQIDWINICKKFLNSLGLIRSPYTTQVENYEHLSSVFDCLKRMNLILVDFV